MSLFSLYSEQKKSYVDPQSVNIEGEVNGLFYSGSIEASFKNTDQSLDKYKFEIGNDLNDQVGFHNIKVEIDGNEYKIKIQEIKEARSGFKEMEKNGEQAIFGKGTEYFSVLNITNVLQNQTIKISVDFELPVTFLSENIIGLFFPLSYPNNDGNIKCDNFSFSVKCSLFELKEKSVISNPSGNFNHSTKTYTINHLEKSTSQISMTLDSNPPVLTNDLDEIANEEGTQIDNNIAICSGKYGSVSFIPRKEEEKIDHDGEEFIFIVDCSGSMSGRPIKVAAQCLLIFIKSLPENCYFNVVRFGSEYVPLFEKPVPYNKENTETALTLAKSLEADLGGTNLSKPFDYIFKKPLSVNDKLRRIFVLTDGCVFDKEKVIEFVKRNSTTTMSNAIGTGSEVDKELVQKIGEKGKGLALRLGPSMNFLRSLNPLESP